MAEGVGLTTVKCSARPSCSGVERRSDPTLVTRSRTEFYRWHGHLVLSATVSRLENSPFEYSQLSNPFPTNEPKSSPIA